MPKRDKQTNLKAAAAILGKIGGRKGGPARARVLTSAQKSDIAKKGAAAANKGK